MILCKCPNSFRFDIWTTLLIRHLLLPTSAICYEVSVLGGLLLSRCEGLLRSFLLSAGILVAVSLNLALARWFDR